MKHIKRGINWFLIIIFTLLGFVGLFLPLVPQVIFFAIALIILSFEVPSVGNYIESKLDRDGFLGKHYHSYRVKFEKYLK